MAGWEGSESTAAGGRIRSDGTQARLAWGSAVRAIGRALRVVVLVGTVLLGSSAHATVTQYADRVAFEAAAGAVAIQDFDSFASASVDFATQPFDFGGFSAYNGPDAASGGSLLAAPVNGTTAMVCSTVVEGAQLVLSFDRPVTAVGFDADNLSDQRTNEIQFDNAANDGVVLIDPVDQTRFWGFVSDTPFTTMTFTLVASPTGTDGFYVDDLTYSAPAPVPFLSATALVVATGLLLVVAWPCVRRDA